MSRCSAHGRFVGILSSLLVLSALQTALSFSDGAASSDPPGRVDSSHLDAGAQPRHSLRSQEITVHPEALAFPMVTQDQQANSDLTLVNSGDAALTISNVTTTGYPFSTNLTGEVTLASGDSVKVNVVFAPSSPGTFVGTLSVYSNDPAHSQVQVSLSGQAELVALQTPPQIEQHWTLPDPHYHEYPVGVAGTTDGRYLVFSQDIPFNGGIPNWAQSTTRLRCVTENREQLWSRSILPGVIPTYATGDSADQYMVAGTRSDDGVTTFGFLAKVNAAGDVIWQRQYSRANREGGYQVLKAVDGYLLICLSSTDSTYTWVVRADRSGQMIWNRKYALAPSTQCYWGVATSDGGFVLVGNSGPMGDPRHEITAFKIDAQGELLWIYKRAFGGGCALGYPFETADHSLRISGAANVVSGTASPLLIKLSASGQEVWFKNYVESSSCSIGNGGIMLANGDMLLPGTKHRIGGGPSDVDLYCVRLDLEGRRLWSFVSGTTMYNQGECIVKRNGGGYILGGACESLPYDGHSVQAQLLYTGVDPLSPMGACCHVNATCSVTTEMDCPAPSVWHGDSQACAPDPCGPPLGACCEPSGSCTLVPAQSCPETSIWQGAGTTCNPNPCLSGACCLRSAPGTCEIDTPARCAAINGWYFGNGTLCAPSDTCWTTGVNGPSPVMSRLQVQIAPNPSARGVVIRCLLPLRSLTTVVLFDASGRVVRRLHEGVLPAGEMPLWWDGRDDVGQDVPSGLYLVRITAPTGEANGRIVLTR